MKKIISLFYIILFFSGCISMMEKTGQFLDGSSEKITALYRAKLDSLDTDFEIAVVKNKENEQSLLITITKYPMMKIRTTYPNEEGIINLVSLEYISGKNQGWNEYSMALLGTGNFSIVESSANFIVNREIEHIQITSGRIQNRDTRITGDEAITALNNRRERILALAKWMNEQDSNIKYLKNIKNFDEYWKPVIFPELVSRRKKPDGWIQEGDVFQRADSIRWNTGYTERTFTEELRPVRDSGTLLKDWEEALAWIHIEYEWKFITDLLSSQIQLRKIK
jgi:hypothetical protein